MHEKLKALLIILCWEPSRHVNGSLPDTWQGSPECMYYFKKWVFVWLLKEIWVLLQAAACPKKNYVCVVEREEKLRIIAPERHSKYAAVASSSPVSSTNWPGGVYSYLSWWVPEGGLPSSQMALQQLHFRNDLQGFWVEIIWNVFWISEMIWKDFLLCNGIGF